MVERSKVVIATHNNHKFVELSAALTTLHLELVPLSDWKLEPAAEIGTTFVENALIKARYACRHTGLPTIADDSGLVVDLLGGAPGIHSSRYAGEHASDEDNNELLIRQIETKRKHDENVRARFVAILVYLEHERNPRPFVAEGIWEGTIVNDPRGNFGFGYDPLFCPDGFHLTAAELEPQLKYRKSHRAQAAKKLVRLLLDQAEQLRPTTSDLQDSTQLGSNTRLRNSH